MGRRGTLGRMHRLLAHRLQVDIDRAAYLVLRKIAIEGAARVSDLAVGMGVEPSTISRHVQNLEAAGLLAKQPTHTDRRVCIAAATEKGSDLVAQMEAERHRLFDQALTGWCDSDLDRFVALFETFAKDLSDEVTRTESCPGRGWQTIRLPPLV